MRSEILEKHREAKIEVYAVWFRNLMADFRFFWPSGALDDPRVVNLWDDQKVAGKWYAANVTRRGAEVEWDAWILYPPGKAFADSPLAWGRSIVASRERLRTEVENLLKPRAAWAEGSIREPTSSVENRPAEVAHDP